MIGTAPDCLKCQWFDRESVGKINCDAYPDSIPEDILMGEPHTEVRPDQEGDFVYQDENEPPQ